MTDASTDVNQPADDTPCLLADLTEPGGPADELAVALFVARERAQARGQRTPVIHALLAELGHRVRDIPADPDPAMIEATEVARAARRARRAAASRARLAAEAAEGRR